MLNFCSMDCRIEFVRKAYKDKFVKVYGDKFNVVGFAGKRVNIECKKCGGIFAYDTKQVWSRELSCPYCRQDERAKIKAEQEETRQRQQAINKLTRLIKGRVVQLEREAQPTPTYQCVCVACGKEFTSTRRGVKYCSKHCRNRLHWKNNELRRERNIKANGLIDKDITLDKLYARDKGVCHICGKQCNYKDFVVVDNTFIVGRDYPSIDHIKPISKGGNHSWGNVKLAHIGCNSKKNNKT